MNWKHELLRSDGKRVYAGQIPDLFPRRMIGFGGFNTVLEGDKRGTVWKFQHRDGGGSLESEHLILHHIAENGNAKEFVPKSHYVQIEDIMMFTGPGDVYDPQGGKMPRAKRVKVLVMERIDDEYKSFALFGDTDTEIKNEVARQLAHVFYSLCQDGVQYRDGNADFVVNLDNIRVYQNEKKIDIKLIDFESAQLAGSTEDCVNRIVKWCKDWGDNTQLGSDFIRIFTEEFKTCSA